MRSIAQSLPLSLTLTALLFCTSGCQSGLDGFKSALTKSRTIFAPEEDLSLDAAPEPYSPIQQASFESDRVGELTWHSSIEEGRAVAQELNKPMMILFTGSDWCVWCTRLKTDVFDKPEFKSWAWQNVVLVELDFPRKKALPFADRMKNEELKAKYDVRGFPTVVFVTPNDQKLGTLNYKEDAGAWVAAARNIVR